MAASIRSRTLLDINEPITERKSSPMSQKKQQHRKKKSLRPVESLETRILLAADVVGLDPADDSTDVAVDANLVASFSDPLQLGPGTGNILIQNADDNTLIEAVNVRSDQVTIEGSTITINPSQDLPGNTNISVQPNVAKVRDLGTEVTTQTIFAEDFEGIPLKNSTLDSPLDDYAVTMTGTLDVTTAGEYTFGINSDDGQELAIDVEQDGLSLIDDEIIFDNNTHGREDRLSTCAFEDNDTLESCVGEGDDAITLAVGQYEFIYVYFERGGGSGGEFFYGQGQLEEWDESAFVLVGDDSQGIGLVDGITATTYKAPAGENVGDLPTAESLIEDESLAIGSENLALADVAENAGGRFNVDNEIPGAADWAAENDPSFENFSDEAPFGWTRDNSDLLEGGAPEYNGWVFLEKDFWIAQQGDQSRTDYELGVGTVALVDPDAHDDFIDNGSQNQAQCLGVLEFGPECGLFTASLDTPVIYLDGVAPNTATLNFDSSWWDEDTQSAETRVEYFDADGTSLGSTVLLRWESIPDSPNFKPQLQDDINARNEEIEVALENPEGAASMVITFDMPYATNDWWWAIDNIEVTADVEGVVSNAINDNTTWSFTTGEGGGGGDPELSDVTAPGDELVRVDGENDGDGNDGPPPGAETVVHVIDDVTQKHLNFLDLGSGFIVTPSVGTTNVTGLRLYTANDAIPRDPASYILEGGSGDSFTVISEGELSLPDERNAGGDIPIDTSLAHQEILFENDGVFESYRLTFPTVKDADAANSMQIAEVEFLGVPAEAPSSGLAEDINGNGEVDFADFLILSGNFGQNVEAGTLGDIDGNGTVEFADFLALSSAFGQTAAIDAVFAGA